ncbi:MAG: xanthine dehydrogenase family protein subunit M [Candidatus Promineifilaceae bacterium]
MKPAPFDYTAPGSVAEASAVLAQNGDEAKILAGGQSLVPAMNFRLVQPTLLVDINRLTELDYIRSEANSLKIGGLTRQRTIEKDVRVGEQAPLLHETMPYIAHWQIRNRGTIGGSLAHADPAAELPVIMVALNARFRLHSTDGDRWVNAADFFEGLFTTSLLPTELLVEVEIPFMIPRTGWSFIEFSRRKGDFALLGVAALLTLDESGLCRDARLVYLNAGEIPISAVQAASMLVGEKPSADLFEAAAEKAAVSEIHPSGDIHASEPYLRHLGRVLTRRALNMALERAGGTGF